MQKNTVNPYTKEIERRAIAQQVEEFIAKGGKVNTIPSKLLQSPRPLAQCWQNDIGL